MYLLPSNPRKPHTPLSKSSPHGEIPSQTSYNRMERIEGCLQRLYKIAPPESVSQNDPPARLPPTRLRHNSPAQKPWPETRSLSSRDDSAPPETPAATRRRSTASNRTQRTPPPARNSRA